MRLTDTYRLTYSVVDETELGTLIVSIEPYDSGILPSLTETTRTQALSEMGLAVIEWQSDTQAEVTQC